MNNNIKHKSGGGTRKRRLSVNSNSSSSTNSINNDMQNKKKQKMDPKTSATPTIDKFTSKINNTSNDTVKTDDLDGDFTLKILII